MKPAIVRAHYHDHTKYWEEKRTELRELRNAYMTRYWSAQGRAPQQITVETHGDMNLSRDILRRCLLALLVSSLKEM